MTPATEIFATGASSMLGWVLGSKTATMIATSVVALPEWTTWMLGPFGSLIGVLVALKWMVGRLSKAEDREEDRRKEREIERKSNQEVLIALVRDSNTVTTSAVEVLREVKLTVEGCPGNNKPPH